MTFRILALQVKLVRVTKRVHEAYYAQLYLTKVYSLHLCASADHPLLIFFSVLRKILLCLESFLLRPMDVATGG